MLNFHEQLQLSLPRLTANCYRVTSSASWEYNCIAWALEITDTWWWPVVGRYWPPDAPREETIVAFVAVDIEHMRPDVVAGGIYGEVAAILSRKKGG